MCVCVSLCLDLSNVLCCTTKPSTACSGRSLSRLYPLQHSLSSMIGVTSDADTEYHVQHGVMRYHLADAAQHATEAQFEERHVVSLRRQHFSENNEPPRNKPKRAGLIRTNAHAPLPSIRLNAHFHHKHERIGTQRRCRMCTQMEAELKEEDPKAKLPNPVQTTKGCKACNVPLCDAHFDWWHKQVP